MGSSGARDPGAHLFPVVPRAGEWFGPPMTATGGTNVGSSGSARAIVVSHPAMTIDALAVEVTSAGSADALGRLVVAAMNGPASAPVGTTLLDTGQFGGLDTTGLKVVTFSPVVLPAGRHAFIFVIQGTVTTAPVLRAVPTGGMSWPVGGTVSPPSTGLAGLSWSGITGAPPATWPAPGRSGTPIIIWMRAA
jgi:hypothetical protein